MAGCRKRTLITVSLAMVVICILLLECGEARRFGGSRSRSSNSRYRSNSRSITRSTDYRSRFGSTISSTRRKIGSFGWKKALVAGGLLYLGSRMYLSRRMYHDHPYRQPSICSNYIDSDENGTIYQMFICPRHFEIDTFSRCCGPEGRQSCCKAVSRTGSVVGSIIGAFILVLIIGTIVYCVCRHKKKDSGMVLNKNEEPGTILVPPQPQPGMGPMPPQPMGYGNPPNPMMGYGPDPNQTGGPMNYGATYGQQPYMPQGYPQQGPLPGQGYPQQPPPPGQGYPQQPPPPGPGYPAPYGQPDMSQPPYPSAPSYPGPMPGQGPPPPGFSMSGPMPSQPPPPYPAS